MLNPELLRTHLDVVKVIEFQKMSISQTKERTMRLNVCKEFVFDSAHHLPGYNGPCANLHGHQWKLEVEVSGEVDKLSGMVVDFVKMKKAVTEVIINKFDHHLINDIMPLPTAENMVMYMVPILEEIS